MVALALAAASVPASAQPEDAGPGMPGATSNAASKAAASATGIDPFKTNEARRRIETSNSMQAPGSKNSGDGIQCGQAVRCGTSASVFCDCYGNVGAS